MILLKGEKTLRHWTIKDLLVFFERGDKAMCCFFGFLNPRLTNKTKKTITRRWTFKNGLGDEKSLVYELILALVSLWVLVNSIKKIPKKKRPIDFFIILLKDIFF